MTSTYLPIIGQGSQPSEEDGAELEFLVMPDEMAIFKMPEINTAGLNTEALQPAKALLQGLLDNLAGMPADSISFDLAGLDIANRRFIDDVLGEGEVSSIVEGESFVRVQESVLAGVWRIQRLRGNQVIADTVEIAAIPRCLKEAAFENAAPQIKSNLNELPSGVMNAPPLLTELNSHIESYRPGDNPHIINLSLLPQTEQDLNYLDQQLGKGGVTLLSRGYGNCRITSTATKLVWWVQYFNSQETLILNTLEVSDVPAVACASGEDIADSRERLQEILQVYLNA